MMFRGDIGDIGFSLRQRQGFRRSMEAATINPKTRVRIINSV
jgi:hypothetical protein